MIIFLLIFTVAAASIIFLLLMDSSITIDDKLKDSIKKDELPTINFEEFNMIFHKNNIYDEGSKLLKSIQDKDTVLQSNESDKLKATAIEIFNLYTKVNDIAYKDITISQLKDINDYLEYLIESSRIPGSQSFIKNEIKINQHYLNSVIIKDSDNTLLNHVKK